MNPPIASAPPVSAGNGAAGGIAPPHNLEAEQSVLGAILLSERAMYPLLIDEHLQPDDFYRERHATIYSAMLELYHAGEPIDVLTVSEHLRQSGRLEQVGGQAAIDALAGAVPAAGNARHYARIVRDNALMRRLLTTTYEIQASVTDRRAPPRDLVEQAERAVLEVAHEDHRKDFAPVADVLAVELDKLQRLSESGAVLTGTPSGFTDLDRITGGFQPGNLIVIAARPSMGKCLARGTSVHDPVTGRSCPIEELVGRGQAGEQVWVTALGPDLRLRPAQVGAFLHNGRQPVFVLRTRLGRNIKATANHPLLTIRGWKRLDELRVGDRIAVPRVLPPALSSWPRPDAELVMLAALIADGSLNKGSPYFYWGAGSAVVTEVARAALALGVRLRVGRPGSGSISNGRQGGRVNPVIELCRSRGIWGHRAEDKRVPEVMFALPEEGIARFLGILYACDGHIYATGRLRQIGYTTISKGLAEDVQGLLLRLGIVSRIRRLRRAVYEGTHKVALEVLITGQEGLRRFCEKVIVPGKTAQTERVLAWLNGGARQATNVDTLPVEVWEEVLSAKGPRPWSQVSLTAGHPPNHNWHVRTRGISRQQAAVLATALNDPWLQTLAVSDVWWDEVASVEPAGEEDTFDLTVPDFHNFVAGDIVVHNSSLVANVAENAAVDHQQPVALFSLEMSESELAQRFIASQARMNGDDLRKGRVSAERWPKIVEASGRLARAPLYIDDSSDIGILEIRAKARRLHQQHPLGLIIIDYLQLMRPDHRVESRVQQVGEMSRGLKILARELEVPVIAISQLSRAVEQRHPPIPQLSDLRESGQIEQDSDLVAFLYRPEYYARRDGTDDDEPVEREGEADLIVAKHRNGGLGTVRLTFRKEYPKFMNYVSPERMA